MKRDLLTILDLTRSEIEALLARARELKALHKKGQDPTPLNGKTLAMIFDKPSTRTRVSFEAGMAQLGGSSIYLAPGQTQLARNEPVADTARVLSRYVDGVVIRTFAQETVEELARHAAIPIINGLTDLHHPCQILADIHTVQEHLGDIAGKRVAWIGDGNNMANSWLDAAALLGFELRLACPEGYEPDRETYERASKLTKTLITEDTEEAAAGADVVTTDVWASMGQEGEAEERKSAFRGYVVDEALMQLAKPSAIFLHCLPAHRGEEVTDAVIEGPQSRVMDEAENRLHAQKALIATLLG